MYRYQVRVQQTHASKSNVVEESLAFLAKANMARTTTVVRLAKRCRSSSGEESPWRAGRTRDSMVISGVKFSVSAIESKSLSTNFLCLSLPQAIEAEKCSKGSHIL